MEYIRSNNLRSVGAKISMVIMAFVSLSEVVIHLYRYDYLERYIQGELVVREAQAFTNLLFIHSFMVKAFYVLAIIFFLLWFSRAYYNLHRLLGGLKYSRGWSIGAWFVPVFMWLGPYQITREFFNESHSVLEAHGIIKTHSKRNNSYVWWWTFWISGSILANISFGGSIEMIKLSIVISIIASSFLAVAAVFAIWVIHSYHQMEQKLNHVKAASISNPNDSYLIDKMV